MQKQDYIEKIAAFIADGWCAADEGDQAIQPVIGSPSPNSARRTCIRPHSRRDAAIEQACVSSPICTQSSVT